MITPSESVEFDPSNRMGTPRRATLRLTTKAATGGLFATMSRVREPEAPRSSTTVRTTGNRPERANAWETTLPLPVDPSPKSQWYDAIVPSRSHEAVPSKVTGSPGSTLKALAAKAAWGGEFGGAAQVTVAFAQSPLSDVVASTATVSRRRLRMPEMFTLT